MTPDARQSIIDKVVKLSRLADADKNDSAAEVASAAAMLQQLMDKHSITELELAAARAATAQHSIDTELNIGSVKLMLHDEKRVARSWEWRLMSTIARHNNCRFIRHSDVIGRTIYFRKVELVGTKQDMAFSEYIYQYVYRECIRLGRESYDSADKYERGTYEAYQYNFGLGMVVAVGQRLKQLRDAQQAAYSNNVQALVIVRKDAIDKYTESLYPTLHKGRQQKGFTDAGAGQAGYRAGQNIPLHNGIEQGQRGLALR